MNNNERIKKENNLFELKQKATNLFRQSFFESNIYDFDEKFVKNYFNRHSVRELKKYIKTVENLKQIKFKNS